MCLNSSSSNEGLYSLLHQLQKEITGQLAVSLQTYLTPAISWKFMQSAEVQFGGGYWHEPKVYSLIGWPY